MKRIDQSVKDKIPLERGPHQWYVINTKPHQEATAKSSLERSGIEVFSPYVRDRRIIRRQRKVVLVPLFPGYLFARFDMSDHYRLVIYARGIRDVVAFGQELATVDNTIIEGIRRKLEDSNGMIGEKASFNPGQVVRIHAGPLHGLEAIFEKEMTGSQRAVLLLRALSYQARVVVDIRHIANM
jgi:transcriptional antiterminator RfaH